MSKKIAFIVNPIAGGNASKSKLAIVEKYAAANKIPVFKTEYGGHARELAAAHKDKYNCLAVFGGDGTINEVAGELIHQKTTMAIIPAGSGNGLAYHLGIPIQTRQALEILNRSAKRIDTIQVNQHVIANVGGLGFDGHVAKLFNESKSRGLITYAKIIFTQLIKFKEQPYSIQFGDKEEQGKAFMIAFANGSEFGNRFKIDPQGDATNGKFSLVIVRKPPFHKLIPLLIDSFRGRLKESAYYKKHILEELKISSPGAILHRDGEVLDSMVNDSFHLKVLPGSLKIIY